MKTIAAAIGLLPCLLVPSALASTPIGTCDELKAAAEATASGEVIGKLLVSEISCESFTDVTVVANKLKLKGDEDVVHMLTNVRFVVNEGAILRVNVPVDFTGDDGQEVNGGLLHVASGGKARFKWPVNMHDVEINTADDATRVDGGCIYNEGDVRFEDTFDATECNCVAANTDIVPGSGSALYNAEGGNVAFRKRVSISDCGLFIRAPEFVGNDGGAIYSAGRVLFAADAEFKGNEADEGGAIANFGVMKFKGDNKASFVENQAQNGGGHMYNEGRLVFQGEASFVDGFCTGAGGALEIRDPATIKWGGPVEFINNTANAHGGAMYTHRPEHLAYVPLDDATYSGNRVLWKDSDFECNDVFVPENEEDGYTCYPLNAENA